MFREKRHEAQSSKRMKTDTLSSLEQLPPHILLAIFMHLSLNELSAIKAASRRMRGVIDGHPQLWLNALKYENDVRYDDAFLCQNPTIKGPNGTQKTLLLWARTMPRFLSRTSLVDTSHIERPLRAPLIIGTHRGRPFVLATSTEGKLASISASSGIEIWDFQTGQCQQRLDDPHAQQLVTLSRGKLASAHYGIKIWDIMTGQCQQTLGEQAVMVFSLIALRGGRLASGSYDGTIKIWDLKTGQCQQTLIGHSDTVFSLAALSGETLVSSSSDNTIKVWDLKTSNCIQTFECRTEVGRSLVALSGDKLATNANDFTIKIWDVKTGECIQALEGHTSFVGSLAALSGGRLASAACDNTVKIWDLDTGRCLHTLTCSATHMIYHKGALYIRECSGTIQQFDFAKIDLTQTSDNARDVIRSRRQALA